MAYPDSATLAGDATFLGRVRIGLTRKALTQLAAPFQEGERFRKRTELARQVLQETEVVVVDGAMTAVTVRAPSIVHRMAWALAANNPTWTVAAQPNDNQVDAALTAAIVDAVAGIATNEQ